MQEWHVSGIERRIIDSQLRFSAGKVNGALLRASLKRPVRNAGARFL